MASPRHAAVLTVSDRVTAGRAEDESGPRLVTGLRGLGWETICVETVADDRPSIEAALIRLIDGGASLVLTTGGTGLSPRDVTPDATRAVGDREVPGIAEALRADGRNRTAHAMLSRAVAVVRGTTLVVNLPGSPRAASEGLALLAPVLDHALDLVAGGVPGARAHRSADSP